MLGAQGWSQRGHQDEECIGSAISETAVWRLTETNQFTGLPWCTVQDHWTALSGSENLGKVSGAQPCPTPGDPMDCSPPGSSAHGILQASILERVAIPFSRGPSLPRGWTVVFHIACRFFPVWATLEAQGPGTRFWKVLPDVLSEVPRGRLREEPGSRWQGGQCGRKPGAEPGGEGQVGKSQVDFRLDVWLCWGPAGSWWHHLEPGLLRFSQTGCRNLCTFVLAFIHLWHPPRLHLSYSTTICFSKSCSVPALLGSLSCWSWPPALTSVASPLGFLGAPSLSCCCVPSGYTIGFACSAPSCLSATGPHLPVNLSVSASEHVTMGTKLSLSTEERAGTW